MNGHAPRVDYTPLKPVQRSDEELQSTDFRVLWFDIGKGNGTLSQDSLLTISSWPRSKSTGIAPLMSQKIHEYFVNLGISESEAWDLHMHYYKNYGLAIRGLQHHHPEFDAEDFDKNCDGALPLEQLLSEDKPLQNLLRSFDRKKVKVMALTNAYKPHALRVLGILGVRDLFEGVISCQYPVLGFPAKPDQQYYEEAMQILGITNPARHYFVDDSLLNIKGAKRLGWHAYWFEEDGKTEVQQDEVTGVIHSIQELREVWKEFLV